MTSVQIKNRKVCELHSYQNNARGHSRKQLKKIERSIAAFGFTNPLIIDENGMVLCGHGRLAAAIALGMDEVPTIELAHMSEAQKRAYIIADNKIAEESSWSMDMLRRELSGLADLDFDLDLTGFDQLEIDVLLGVDDAEQTNVDDDVHLPGNKEAPICRVGDLWECGPHRLIVGDARDPLVLERLMDGARAQLIITDPPYGCQISGNVSGLGKVKHEDFLLGAGETSLAEFGVTILRPALKNIARHAVPGAIAFVCTDWRAAPYLLDAAQGVFHETKNLIVWVKSNAGMGSFYRSGHELIYAFKVSSGPHINNFGLGEGGRHRTNVWCYPGANVFRAGRMQDLADHPTVKPKKMVADAILDCSKVNGIVLDVFAGSGTTIVAAAITRRKGYGIELDSKYADVILRRIWEASSIEPTLDGEPFTAIAAERVEVRHG
jgi:DNA modification methylase